MCVCTHVHSDVCLLELSAGTKAGGCRSKWVSLHLISAESLLAPEHSTKDQIKTWSFPKERRQRRLSLENEKSRVLGLGGTLGSSWGSGRGPFRAPPDQKPPASGFWQDTLWTLRYTISFPAEQQARSALTQKLAGMEAPPRPLVPMCVSGSLPGQGRAHRGIKERRAELINE